MPRPTSPASVLFAVIVAGCGQSPPPGSRAALMADAGGDILTTAQHSPPLGTWVRLVQAAGLVDELSGDGPFTVFVPTQEAFEALPPAVQEDLFNPEHKARLRAVLLYHVLPGVAVLSADVRPAKLATADAGRTVDMAVDNGTVTVNGARVIRADVACRNGIVHWVDRVLVP